MMSLKDDLENAGENLPFNLKEALSEVVNDSPEIKDKAVSTFKLFGKLVGNTAVYTGRVGLAVVSNSNESLDILKNAADRAKDRK